MSEMITFDIDDQVSRSLKKQEPVIEKHKIFQIYGEDHPLLYQALPEFDFLNPPVNAIEFASSLVETCKLHKGIGLAANQCGFKHRVFVMGSGDSYVAFFNPKIINESDNLVHIVEGCLSFPLLSLRITRPEEINVEYQDFNGEKRTAKYTGISARCFQHELDHMNGIVYTDRAKPLALKFGNERRKKMMKKLRLK
jgi:peptide deformylase